MHLDSIYKVFKNRKGKQMNIRKSYSVLLPLVKVEGELHILFEVRAKDLETQPGEISFPGGAIENNETPIEACIRETCEELGVNEKNINIIGELDYIGAPANIQIFAFVGMLDIKKIQGYSNSEVDHCFLVPLTFFYNTEPDKYYSETDIKLDDSFPYGLIPNGKKYIWRKGKYPIHFYNYNGYIIWGITAKFIDNFISTYKQYYIYNKD